MKARLACIEEQETAGLVRMSHGLLFARASNRQVLRFDMTELPRLYISDADAPEAGGARRALAAFGAALVHAEKPSTLTLAAQSFVLGTFCSREPSGEQTTFDDMPFDAFDTIVAFLDDDNLSMVASVNRAFCSAARLCARSRDEAAVARQMERLAGVVQQPHNSVAYFNSICGCRVVVATFWDRHRRWLPFSGILEYEVSLFADPADPNC